MQPSRTDIENAIRSAQGLPCFPTVVLELERELARPDCSLLRLRQIIEQDPGLVAKTLQLVNSALYAPRSGVRTAAIGEALVRLGMTELKRLAVATAILEKFRGFGGVDEPRFWVHSLSVALASRAVATLAGTSVSEEVRDIAFTAGLLHDLGALLLHHFFPEACEALTAQLEQRGGSVYDLERELWALDHGEAGAMLAEQWSLPTPMIEVLRFHHSPWQSSSRHRTLVQLVHIADFVCTNQGYGRREGGFPDCFDHGAWDALGLSFERIPQIIEAVRQQGEASMVFAGALALHGTPPAGSRGGVERSDTSPAEKTASSRELRGSPPIR